MVHLTKTLIFIFQAFPVLFMSQIKFRIGVIINYYKLNHLLQSLEGNNIHGLIVNGIHFRERYAMEN